MSFLILLFAFVIMTFNCLWCLYQWQLYDRKYFYLVDKVGSICDVMIDTIKSLQDV